MHPRSVEVCYVLNIFDCDAILIMTVELTPCLLCSYRGDSRTVSDLGSPECSLQSILSRLQDRPASEENKTFFSAFRNLPGKKGDANLFKGKLF